MSTAEHHRVVPQQSTAARRRPSPEAPRCRPRGSPAGPLPLDGARSAGQPVGPTERRSHSRAVRPGRPAGGDDVGQARPIDRWRAGRRSAGAPPRERSSAPRRARPDLATPRGGSPSAVSTRSSWRDAGQRPPPRPPAATAESRSSSGQSIRLSSAAAADRPPPARRRRSAHTPKPLRKSSGRSTLHPAERGGCAIGWRRPGRAAWCSAPAPGANARTQGPALLNSASVAVGVEGTDRDDRQGRSSVATGPAWSTGRTPRGRLGRLVASLLAEQTTIVPCVQVPERIEDMVGSKRSPASSVQVADRQL